MIVLGITGVAGAGKSTVAEYLVNDWGFKRLSFAAPLKKMLRTLDPIVGTVNGQGVSVPLSALFEHLDGDELEVKASRYGDEYRRLLQVLGTDCIRAVDENFWVNAAMKQMDNPEGKYVFDDVRFPNEAEVIRGYDPFGLWNVERPGYAAVNGHTSEQWAGQMGETIWLHNGSDLEVLRDQIDNALDIISNTEARV